MNYYTFPSRLQAMSAQSPSAPYRAAWCDAWTIDAVYGDALRCPRCGHYISSKEWLAPRKIRLTSTKFPDRLTHWLPEPLVVSGRFCEAYRKSGLSGIERFLPITVVKVGKRATLPSAVPDYYCARIPFIENVCIDDTRSEITGQPYGWSCALCNPLGTTRDHVMNLALTVSGPHPDIFQVYGHGIVVTQCFYDFVSAQDFKNFDLIPVEDYRF